MVFIGAAVLPLLETEEAVLGASRPTQDVDAVTATTSYSEKARVEEELRARGFRHAQEPPTHVDRWRAPDDTIFDLVGCGAHIGGTGSVHDLWVIDNAVKTDLPPLVCHASAVGLLLLKCDAYNDRGRKNPLNSKDLADIVTLCATRPGLVDDVLTVPSEIRAAIAVCLWDILASGRTISAVRTHVDDREPLIPNVAEMVLDRMRAMAGVG